MPPRFGIDTSIFVRLLTGDPAEGFDRAVQALTALVEEEQAEILVSNQVIGETYVVLQHHYGVAKPEARAALVSVLRSGLVTPQNGVEIFAALAAEKGCGLLDRLIADDYERRGLTALTLDARKARLPNARRL